jgi:AsmA protein
MDGALQNRPGRSRKLPRVVLVLGTIALVLALLVVGLGFGAERIVNKQKDAALAELSAQLGRPVTAGRVRLALLRGRVEVRDIVVGRDPALPQEPDPAFRLDRAYVAVPLWPAIRSLGKRVEVSDILAERPLVQVSRDKDGKLNWQRIAEKLDTGEPPKKSEPMDAATRERVQGAVIRNLRIDDARFRFVDLSREGAAAEIADLDVALRDVSLGAPFEAQISAAVLEARKNFDLRAKFTTPAAPSAGAAGQELPAPALERLTIKLEPVALAPLAPFAASVIGAGLEDLAEGKLSMDWQVAPGAGAPGGQGPTSVRGFVAMEALKFAGGERFDARLDTEVGGDLDKGALDITQLRARLGDMGLLVQGRLTELAGAPRVEKLTVQSEGLDFTRLRGYYPPLDRITGAELRGPFTVEAQGQGSADEQTVTARLDLTTASVIVPGQLRKPAGTPLSVELKAVAGKELVRVERLALTLAKVVMTARASLRTQGTGAGARQTFEANLDAPAFAVREVGALVAPKETAGLPDVRVAIKAKASGTVGRPESIKAEIPELRLTSGRSDLQGKLTLENAKTPRISFDGRSKYLDMDDFVPRAKEEPAGAKTEKKTEKKTAAKPEPLPPVVREMKGTVKLAVERGRASGIDYRDLRTDVTLDKGKLQARTLEVGAFGGRFSGAGSELPLPGTAEAFLARGEVEGLDIAAVIAHFAGDREIFTGKLSGKLDLNGVSVEPKDVLATLTGLLSGKVTDAQFMPASLLEPVAQAIETAARGTPLSATLKAASDRASNLLRDRHLKDLAGALKFADGAMAITTPLKAQTPSGPLSLAGRITLEGQADLNAELALSPEVASALVGGKARFDGPVPVKLRIDGPIKKPRIRPDQPAQLAKVFLTALAKSTAGEAVRAQAAAATGRAREQAQEQAAKATEAAEATRKAAEERARQEAEKAKEAAGRRLRGILGR